MSDMLEDLREATAARGHQHMGTCPLCEYINSIQDPTWREALINASKPTGPGSIGRDKLAAILRKYNTGIGQKTIRRHRTEGHTP